MPVKCNALIFGGGVAGLWILGRLSDAGYGCVLVESDALGAGQTIGSQGIIHGGIKYALTGSASRASRAVAAMPPIWRGCLEGRGEIDLSGVRVLSDGQYLWTTRDMKSRVAGFLASKVFSSQCQPVDPGDVAPFRDSGGRASVYRIEEQVLDPRSLVAALAERSGGIKIKVDRPEKARSGGSRAIELGRGDASVVVEPDVVILAAGSGNEALLGLVGAGVEASGGPLMQRRPLHMAMVRGPGLPKLYGHCMTASSKPRLTVTSQEDRAGRTVWYVGGLIAEDGVGRDAPAQVATARAELDDCLPWIDWSAPSIEWATCRWDRAEGFTEDGSRPDEPVLRNVGPDILVWPTKLAFAPRLAAEVLAAVRSRGIVPAELADRDAFGGFETPAVAELPWEREGVEWIF